MQSLKHALDLGPREVISFIGGGGKTTAMFTLAAELARYSRVLVTTTTKINFPDAQQVVLASNPEEALDKLGRVGVKGLSVLGTREQQGKLHGILPQWVDGLKQNFDFILVEADGSARKPLKGHADYEPVIPKASTVVVAISGMSVMGKPLTEQYVHRPGLLAEYTGYAGGAPVTTWLVARAHEEMKERIEQQAPTARKIGLLNQAEKEQVIEYRRLAQYLAGNCYQSVLWGELLPAVRLEKITATSIQPVAAVVLAAGRSARMGEVNKLLLQWKGKSIIRHTVKKVLMAVGKEVTVVLGYQQNSVRKELADLPVNFTLNEQFQQGQAGSLKKGLEAVGKDCLGAMFVLGDQPFIPSGLLSTLAAAFRIEEPPALYPVYHGWRGNPVLFHKKLFPQLLEATGDSGGRRLLQQLRGKSLEIPTDSDLILTDIDTPEDWEKLKKKDW